MHLSLLLELAALYEQRGIRCGGGPCVRHWRASQHRTLTRT
jgi:hypothetical protein